MITVTGFKQVSFVPLLVKAWLTQAPAEEEGERGARPGAWEIHAGWGGGSCLVELVKVATISG